MAWLRTAQRVVISGLLIIALNQHLLLWLMVSPHEVKPAPVACACPPAACMCSPTSGCEHNHPGMLGHKMTGHKEKRQMGVCYLKSNRHEATYHFSWGWEVPILSCHLAKLIPYPSFTYLNLLPAGFAIQQYSTPPDKPPQTLPA